jgi:cell division protein FtsQ
MKRKHRDLDEAAPVRVKVKKKRKKKRYLLKVGLFILLAVGLYCLFTSSLFDIREIQVESNEYYTAHQIIDKTGIMLGDNLLGASMRDLKKRLLADPYIAGVQTKRALPNVLVVRVTERREESFVQEGKRFIIIDGDGMVLRRAEAEPTLTELSNIHVTRAEEGRPLEAEENAALTDALTLMKEAKNKELYFKKIDISNIIIRTYVYDHLICEGAPDQFTDNLGRLKKLLLQLKEDGIERGVVKIGADGYIAWQPAVE